VKWLPIATVHALILGKGITDLNAFVSGESYAKKRK